MKLIRPARGFTLIELIVTLLMAAIILSAGVPSFRNMILNNRQTAEMNNFLTTLMIARSEAVKRHVNTVTVCTTTDGINCTGAGGWEQGWMVFDDINSDLVAQPAELIRVYESLVNDGLTLRGNALVTNTIIFSQTGMVNGPGGIFTGTFRMCDFRGQTSASGLILSITGRPTRAVDSNGDGIVEGGGGLPVPCP